MINSDAILEDANNRYAEKKFKKGIADAYTPPEALPHIRSDQVTAVVEVLTEYINKQVLHLEDVIREKDDKIAEITAKLPIASFQAYDDEEMKRLSKATDMADVLWTFKERILRGMIKYGYKPAIKAETPEEMLEAIYEKFNQMLEENNIDLDEIYS